MKLAILLLVTIFIGNIAMAGVSSTPCPQKAGGKLLTSKPNVHTNLMPTTPQTQKPADNTNSADSKP